MSESGIAMQSGPLPAWWPELPAGDFHQQGRGFLCAAPRTSKCGRNGEFGAYDKSRLEPNIP